MHQGQGGLQPSHVDGLVAAHAVEPEGGSAMQEGMAGQLNAVPFSTSTVQESVEDEYPVLTCVQM